MSHLLIIDDRGGGLGPGLVILRLIVILNILDPRDLYRLNHLAGGFGDGRMTRRRLVFLRSLSRSCSI